MKIPIRSQLALFASGIFFGGALDHLILALMGSEMTPYGVRSGVLGNWGLMAVDFVIAVLLYLVFRRVESRGRER